MKLDVQAIAFNLDSPESTNSSIDRLVTQFGEPVELLGLGEALHGGEEILIFRNRLFQRLVERHGYSAIAIESSFPRGRLVDDYVAGWGQPSFDAVAQAGFSHGFGRLEANRELVEWMRHYNSDPSHRTKIRFYGFDSPTEMSYADSPGHILRFVLDYITALDDACGKSYRQKIEPLLGRSSDWEKLATLFDPSKSIGLSSAARQLRIELEDLMAELLVRRPEFVSRSGKERYSEAVHYARLARWLLGYHAVMGEKSSQRTSRLLGIRDACMAENLAYILSCEQGRGRILAYAHNSHLQKGRCSGSSAMSFSPGGRQDRISKRHWGRPMPSSAPPWRSRMITA